MKNCIMLWKNDAVDLAINNQRRAFSDAYNNEVLAESKIYIELSSKNPLSKLSSLETEDLKNTPCILVINQTGQQDTACKEPGSRQKKHIVPSGKKIIPDIISKNLQIFSNPAFRDIYNYPACLFHTSNKPLLPE